MLQGNQSISYNTAEQVELRKLVRDGRLLEVQTWIRDGKPLGLPDRRTKHVLRVAVETGFHSMVEVLAKAITDPAVLNETLRVAIEKKRIDLAWLLVDRGADPKSVHLETVAVSCDKALLKYFFDRWDSLGNDRGLFEIVCAMPYPLTGLIREFAPKVANHKIQLGAALNHFIANGNPKWAALSMWMGADPRLPAPDEYDKDWAESECWETPVYQAISHRRMDVLKLMKVSKQRDNLNELLERIHFFHSEDEQVADYLLNLGADINNKPNGGSSILDGLLRSNRMPRFYSHRESVSVHSIERWVSRGARYVPNDSSDIRDARSAVRYISSWDLPRFMRVLARGTTEDVLYQVLNSTEIRMQLDCTPSGLRQKVSDLYVRLERRRQGLSRHMPDAKQTRFKQLKPRFVSPKSFATTRAEFYDTLWAASTTQVAEKYGLSDVALGKLCKSYNIPKPGLGYWAKKAAGKCISPMRLPEPSWNPGIEIRSYMAAPDIPDHDLGGKVASLIKKFSQKEVQVKIPSRTERLHPAFTKEVEESLTERMRSRRIARDGFEPDAQDHELDNERIAERAIRVLNALLLFLESAGFELSPDTGPHYRHHFIARIFGHAASFSLEREDSRLRLMIYRAPYSMRTTWTDGKKHFIEMYFVQLACSLAYVAALNDERTSL